MDKKRNCQNPECGKEFEAVRDTARFCSDKCSKRAYNLKKQALSVTVTLQCEGPGCTKTVIRNPSGVRPHNFCCRACRVAWRQETRPTKVCAQCGEDFRPHFTKEDQRYCSARCAEIVARQKAEAAKIRQQECMAQTGERDMAAEVLSMVPYSSLWRGKGMLPTYSPLLNSDVYVGY